MHHHQQHTNTWLTDAGNEQRDADGLGKASNVKVVQDGLGHGWEGESGTVCSVRSNEKTERQKKWDARCEDSTLQLNAAGHAKVA